VRIVSVPIRQIVVQYVLRSLRAHFVPRGTDDFVDEGVDPFDAAAARDANFDAVLAPAAALSGCQTLAVFVHALPNVEPERSEVRQPPPRLAELLPLIRPHEHVPDSVRRLLETVATTYNPSAWINAASMRSRPLCHKGLVPQPGQ